MQIYVVHSREFDYKNELYRPLRDSSLNSLHKIILPHETDTFINSKEIIKTSDLIIAEASFPATGEGIELGWADSFGISIACFYKVGTKPSGSLKAVTDKIIAYVNSIDLVSKIDALVAQR